MLPDSPRSHRRGVLLAEALLAGGMAVTLLLSAWRVVSAAGRAGAWAEDDLEATLHSQALLEGLQALPAHEWPELPEDQVTVLMELGSGTSAPAGSSLAALEDRFHEGPRQRDPAGGLRPLERRHHRVLARRFPGGSIHLRLELGWRRATGPGKDPVPTELVLEAVATPGLPL
jgi:hypothetical protein